MSKSHFCSLVLGFVLIGVFTLAFNVQPANVNASSSGETVQATGTDWWPMFHHDLNHTRASTSIGPSTNYLLWKSPGWINWVLSSPAVVDYLVYVGSEDNNVHCLNASTGGVVWNYTTGGYTLSSPAVADGLVYMGSLDGKVYCLNAATGALVWSYTTGASVSSSPTVVNGRVYVGSDDYSVYCLDASTGAHIWDYKTDGGMGYSCPAVAGGLVYVGSLDSKVYCLNAANGAFVWSYKTGASVYSSPAVVGGLVYVGSLDGKVYCLNAVTGAFIWSYETGDKVWSSPAVAGVLVYVGSYDDNVYCLNAVTGAFIWSYETGDKVESSPAVASGFVFVGSRDNFFYCLNAGTGAFVWSYETGGWVESSSAVVEGVVYVGSADGHVYAFGSPIAVSISPSSFIMDVGQSKQFSSSVTGGKSPYTYQWYLNGAPVSGATSNNWTLTPFFSGSYTLYLSVTDSTGETTRSQASNVTVNSIIPKSQPLRLPIVLKGTANWVSLFSNSTVSTFKFNETQIEISFNVSGASGTTGYSNVTIPKQLMWAESGKWRVLVGGGAVMPTVTEDTNNTNLYFTYGHSTKTVEIRGTNIGEAPQQAEPFPTTWILGAIAIIAIAAATGYLFLKRKK
jgi:outer membrane protein assembly factor BamB